ncbi:MAG TPA: serine dehydratase subunit alpha family protein [Candidatus Avacidaminococcus intestinavium]|uniref:UPF0597 protein IAB06_01460 n=1 Tax=Candidatus Avacidaminococcus intestinavium TaxID=2840684 RepID=A0A9D1SKC9_9FIRM|nr:serine dehydratase subunit alpha family protein [Candidatus Avacidaminococcus intestinavium]
MKDMTNLPHLWRTCLAAIKKEVVPALGCTEPISLAFAAAVAASYLQKPIEKIEAKVSANLMKNGMGVTVPGTETTGLIIAAAVGALGGNPDAKLEVLKNITSEQVAAAKQMLADNKVTISVADVTKPLYAEATLFNGADYVKVAIADDHTNVILIEQNHKVLFAATINTNLHATKTEYSLAGITAADIYDFAMSAPLSLIDFIEEAATMNENLSALGMSGKYGMKIGATINSNIKVGMMENGLLTQILMRTAAASDARMGGATLPAMTNSGSGNQGIAATMPVVVVAQHLKVSRERLVRALVLSHMMAIYIHDRLPKLSAFCAVTSASMGAAAGMSYLLKPDFSTVSMAISNMIGDVSGMICDGASNSCAMKVSTSAGSAFKAVLMALEGIRVSGTEGIVAEELDSSINNLGKLACQGMAQTDAQILQIMLDKMPSYT